jgi:hypothetical protein
VEHGFDPHAADDGSGGADGTGAAHDAASAPVGHVVVTMANTGTELTVAVHRRRRGPPRGVRHRTVHQSLGLSIVRDLVESQLEGDITMVSLPESDPGGTRVVIIDSRASPPIAPPIGPGTSRDGCLRRCAGTGSEGAL